jgi:DNA-binding transcriptional MocR family regulator
MLYLFPAPRPATFLPMPATTPGSARVTLYEELARRFARAIENGALRPGDRLPSVRALRGQEHVSTATVMQALARLEALGLVESRPRSGIFVRPRRTLPAPAPTRPECAPCPVTVASLVARVLADHRDPRLVPLGSATPPAELLPAAALSRALAAVTRAGHGAALDYEEHAGFDRLRRAIARRALAWGFAAAPDDVVVTAGATEAVALALRAVTSPGDAVAIESPAFYGTLQALEGLGLRAVEIPCRSDTGLDVGALEEVLGRQRVAAVVAVPNFSNPAGSLMPEAEKRRLVALLAARGIPLVEDDVYGDLALDGPRPPSAKAFDREGLVLSCGSFSKTLAPGWRVGWMLPGRFAERVLQLKFALSLATSSAPQRALARFLDTEAYDRHLRRLCGVLRCSAERLRDAVTASFPAGTRVSRPRGGYVLWVELPEGVDALALYSRALDAGVSLVPGTLCGARGGYERFVRMSFARPWDERLQQGVETVGRIAARMAEAARR